MARGSSDPDAREVRRVNNQLEERHYEFRSNCNDGDGEWVALGGTQRSGE